MIFVQLSRAPPGCGQKWVSLLASSLHQRGTLMASPVPLTCMTYECIRACLSQYAEFSAELKEFLEENGLKNVREMENMVNTLFYVLGKSTWKHAPACILWKLVKMPIRAH